MPDYGDLSRYPRWLADELRAKQETEAEADADDEGEEPPPPARPSWYDEQGWVLWFAGAAVVVLVLLYLTNGGCPPLPATGGDVAVCR